MPALYILFPRQARCISVENQTRHAMCAADHLDVAEGCRADPFAEGLERSFLRGEPDGETRCGIFRRAARMPARLL